MKKYKPFLAVTVNLVMILILFIINEKGLAVISLLMLPLTLLQMIELIEKKNKRVNKYKNGYSK